MVGLDGSQSFSPILLVSLVFDLKLSTAAFYNEKVVYAYNITLVNLCNGCGGDRVVDFTAIKRVAGV